MKVVIDSVACLAQVDAAVMTWTLIVGSLWTSTLVLAGPGALTHAGTWEVGSDHVGNMADTDSCCFLSLTD